MFHTGFQSSVQLMLITAVFLFSLNSGVFVSRCCVSVYIFSPSTTTRHHPPSLPPPPSLLLVTVSPRVMITSPFLVCCVHLDLKLITSDNLVVLFPKFKSFSGERERESDGVSEGGRERLSRMERIKHVGGTYHL